jgi:hypothetical protein
MANICGSLYSLDPEFQEDLKHDDDDDDYWQERHEIRCLRYKVLAIVTVILTLIISFILWVSVREDLRFTVALPLILGGFVTGMIGLLCYFPIMRWPWMSNLCKFAMIPICHCIAAGLRFGNPSMNTYENVVKSSNKVQVY